jgi:hypothetical protein
VPERIVIDRQIEEVGGPLVDAAEAKVMDDHTNETPGRHQRVHGAKDSHRDTLVDVAAQELVQAAYFGLEKACASAWPSRALKSSRRVKGGILRLSGVPNGTAAYRQRRGLSQGASEPADHSHDVVAK